MRRILTVALPCPVLFDSDHMPRRWGHDVVYISVAQGPSGPAVLPDPPP